MGPLGCLVPYCLPTSPLEVLPSRVAEVVGDWRVLLAASEGRGGQVMVTMLVTRLAPSSRLHITLLRVSGLPRGADGNTPVFTEMGHTVDWGNSETLILTLVRIHFLVYKKEI